MGLGSQTISQSVVYAQPTKPTDTRDGVFWVDTADPKRPTYVYSSDTGGWEPVGADNPIFATQELLSFEEAEANLTKDESIVYGGKVVPETHFGYRFDSVYLDDDDDTYIELGPLPANSGGYNWYTLDDNVGDIPAYAFEIYLRASETADRGPELRRSRITDSEGNSITLDHENADWGTGESGVVHEFTLAVTNDQEVTIDKIELELANPSSSTETSYRVHEYDIQAATGRTKTTSFNFGEIPEDLAGWDRVDWQFNNRDGDTTFDVLADDGTGWTTIDADVVPPVNISSIDEGSDVRLDVAFTAPSTLTEDPPYVNYFMRRGVR